MQDCSGDLSGAKDASQLADGWVVVGRSGWHGICSPGKHRLCLYGISTQQWSCQCLTYRDSASGPTRTVWPWGLDRHSWCSVVPRECATPLSHYRRGYTVCLVSEGDDAAHTTVNVAIAVGFCSSCLFSWIAGIRLAGSQPLLPHFSMTKGPTSNRTR